MLKAEWGLIEFVRISSRSDTNFEFPHFTQCCCCSCHPPNPHFVTRPILISFSHVFLLVFLISTFMIFQKAYFSVVLTNSSVFADAWQWDRLQLLWLFQELPQNSVAGGRKKPRIILFFLVKLLCINWWTGAMNNSFPSSTDWCHQTKPGHVVLMPQSAVGLRLENLRVLRLIYSRSQIFASSHIVFLFHQNWWPLTKVDILEPCISDLLTHPCTCYKK